MNHSVVPSQARNATAPLLTIVIPTYNRLPALGDTLRSVLDECAGAPVEVIVVDDCSTDGTWAWLSDRFSRSSQVRVIQTPRNSGCGSARNLGLSVAAGRYLLPVDSDVLLIGGAFARIEEAIKSDGGAHPVLFFRCVEHPGSRVLDPFIGATEITREMILFDEIGEMLPLVDIAFLRARGLEYANVRAGEAGILWARIISERPGFFFDIPLARYRTDVSGRICTGEYQLAHAAHLAMAHDAYLPLYDRAGSRPERRARARRLLKSGTYHLLAGHSLLGARRLLEAATAGNVFAPVPLVVSMFGPRALREAFLWHRQREARSQRRLAVN